jgi:hypothetical protein
MRRCAGLFVTVVTLAIGLPAAAFAQLSTPPPTATAENENWYLSGSPINLGGVIYYPAGPVTHFNRNEMVFTGVFDLIPVYRRTTQEPGSVVYVPLTGGLVRPYERRRSGELAGTSGSTVSSFPVVLPAEQASQTATGAAFFPALTAALPRPVGTTGFLYGTADQEPRPVGGTEMTVPLAVGTTGVTGPAGPLPIAAVRPGPARIETVRRPVGLNTVFLEFRAVRWYSAGPAVELVREEFSRIGDYHGFPVYEHNARKDMIYVSLVPGEAMLVVPYKSR